MARHRIITLSDSSNTAVSPEGTHSGMDITIQNLDPVANVYIGGSSVSTSNYGFKIIPGGAWSVELPPRDNIFVISDVDGSEVAVLSVNLEYQN